MIHPIEIFDHANGGVKFTHKDEDYFLLIICAEVEEYVMADQHCEIGEAQRYLYNCSNFCPTVIKDFILYSRQYWRPLIDLEFAN